MRTIETESLAKELFNGALHELHRLTDKVFSYLLLCQWVAAILCALVVSPRTWVGPESTVHTHLIAAIVLGGLLTIFPLTVLRTRPGSVLSRQVAASAQMMFSALLIHLMAGRIEAHFHIFGSLALLSFYRDWRVYLPAVGITLLDHLYRGIFWPESVFGVGSIEILRAFEHAGWVVFEVVFLLWGVQQSRTHLWKMSRLQASLEEERDNLEVRVNQRTSELNAANEYLENVFDSLDAHIAILDSDGVILSTNSAWKQFGEENGGNSELCGIGANYLQVSESSDGSCNDEGQQVAQAIRKVIAGTNEGTIIEYPCTSPTEERWFQARVSSFNGDSKGAVVVAHVDVTERVAATQSSKADAKRAASLAKIISESPNEVYIFNQSDYRFEVVNDGATQATGYSRAELLSMTPIDLKPELDRASFEDLLRPLATGKTACIDFQTLHQRKDGLNYPVQVLLHTAVYDSMPVYVAFVADLSEIRQLESKLAQSQKLESIGQLAAGIAHEINTPMQCVSNNVQFLKDCNDRLFEVVDKLIATLDSDARPWAERKQEVDRLLEEARYARITSMAPSAIADAAEASRRVVDIVRAMKAMSHPGTRDKVEVDLNEILENAITISRNRWKYCAELELKLDPDLPPARVLPAELHQVFLNLIVNAADAIYEKNGENSPPGKIVVRTQREGESIRIEIDDSGPGIPEEIRDRIFDPFFTTKEVGKGTGQGLAITYDIITNKHAGTVEVLSTDGVGATFVIHLPIPGAPEEQPSDLLGSAV